jgi:Flp pilus assembly protein TadG
MNRQRTDSSTSGLVSRRRRRGSSVIETTLIFPWFVFLFVGAFDWGFFAHALISVESAARVAALYSASQSSAPSVSTLCPIVRNELKIVSNVNDSLTCTSSPLVVSVTSGAGPDGQTAYTVSVTYTTLQLIPIPGLLKGQSTFTRFVQVRPRV